MFRKYYRYLCKISSLNKKYERIDNIGEDIIIRIEIIIK